jgi:hypothetical protein
MAATLYLLHVPLRPGHFLGLDYPISHLHVSNSFDTLLIVVDHLTRMAEFLPCTKRVTTEETPTLLIHGVYTLHELPRVMISDIDPKFVNGLLWRTLCRRLGTQLSMSSSQHHETDGLT